MLLLPLLIHALVCLFKVSKGVFYFLGVAGEIIFIAGGFVGAGEYPNMGVSNFVTRNSRPNGFLVESFLLDHGDFFRHLEIVTNVWHLPHPTIMRFRNYLAMAGRTGIDVEEGEEVVILINNFRRDFFLHNFTKHAIRHADIIC